MTVDPISVLREAGVPVDSLSAAQRSALSTLTEEELATLKSIQQRMVDAGAGEIEGEHTFVFVY